MEDWLFIFHKKGHQTLPKVQIDDDFDLIDEDSLLSEEDLKKPQLPDWSGMPVHVVCMP